MRGEHLLYVGRVSLEKRITDVLGEWVGFDADEPDDIAAAEAEPDPDPELLFEHAYVFPPRSLRDGWLG